MFTEPKIKFYFFPITGKVGGQVISGKVGVGFGFGVGIGVLFTQVPQKSHFSMLPAFIVPLIPQ